MAKSKKTEPQEPQTEVEAQAAGVEIPKYPAYDYVVTAKLHGNLTHVRVWNSLQDHLHRAGVNVFAPHEAGREHLSFPVEFWSPDALELWKILEGLHIECSCTCLGKIEEEKNEV